MATPSWFDARQFGQLGTADDTATIQAALDTAEACGGGMVILPVGTFTAAGLVLGTSVGLSGVMRGTVIKRPNGSSSPILSTRNYDSLVGGGTNGGVHSFRLADITFDGNRTGGATGDGVRIYGSTFDLDKVTIRNCTGRGLVSEWALVNGPGVAGDGLDASVYGLRVHRCGDATNPQVYWNGPHDSLFVNTLIWSMETGYTVPVGLHVGPKGGGSQFTQAHIWGTAHAWAVKSEAPVVAFTDPQIEGATTGLLWVLGDGNRVTGGRIFRTPAASVVGVRIGEAGGENPTMTVIRTHFAGTNAGCIDFANDGGSAWIDAVNYQAAGSWVTGTPSANSSYRILVTGQAGGGVVITH